MYRLLIVLVGILTLLAVPFRAESAPLEPTVVASRLVERLVLGDFVGASENFDDTVRVALPPDKLEAVWKQIVAQAGPFQRRLGTTTKKAQLTQSVIVTCAFEKANIDVKVAVNAQNQVVGLFFAPATPAQSYVPPAYVRDGSYRQEEVQVRVEDIVLPGTLALPVSSGAVPAVVLLQGSGPNDRDETVGPNKPFRDIALGLASSGIAVLRYDKRTLVRPDAPHATVADEVLDDARQAIALLRTRKEVIPERIFVLGHSLGGMLLPRLALQEKRLAGSIILAGPARPLEDVLLSQVSYLSAEPLDAAARAQLATVKEQVARVKSPTLSAQTLSSELPLGLPASYWLDLRGYHPPTAAKLAGIPLLIAQGARDYQVTREDFDQWQMAVAGRKDVYLKLYPGLNHLFIASEGKSQPSEYAVPGHVDAEVVSDIAAWIKDATR